MLPLRCVISSFEHIAWCHERFNFVKRWDILLLCELEAASGGSVHRNFCAVPHSPQTQVKHSQRNTSYSSIRRCLQSPADLNELLGSFSSSAWALRRLSESTHVSQGSSVVSGEFLGKQVAANPPFFTSILSVRLTPHSAPLCTVSFWSRAKQSRILLDDYDFSGVRKRPVHEKLHWHTDTFRAGIENMRRTGFDNDTCFVELCVSCCGDGLIL